MPCLRRPDSPCVVMMAGWLDGFGRHGQRLRLSSMRLLQLEHVLLDLAEAVFYRGHRRLRGRRRLQGAHRTVKLAELLRGLVDGFLQAIDARR